MSRLTPLLVPAAGIYRFISGARNWLFDHEYLAASSCRLPVVSVGNITAGGTGKTPLVNWIAKQLSTAGVKAAVLSRGYGARIRHPRLVSPVDDYREVGDEPLLLARAQIGAVVVSPNRVAGAHFIGQHALGDLIILDDGLQHRALKRDLNIVAVNGATRGGFDQLVRGELLPLGRLREKPQEALRRVDLLVLSYRRPEGSDANFEGELREWAYRNSGREIPVVSSWLVPGELRLIGSSVIEASGGEVVAVSAIADASGFLQTLSSLGYTTVHHAEYRDHYPIKLCELEAVARRFPGLALVCTAKDAVKFGDLGGLPVYQLETALEVSNPELIIDMVTGAMRAARTRVCGSVEERL